MFKKIFRFLRFSTLIVAFVFLLLPFMAFSVVNKGIKKAKNLLGFKKAADDQSFFDDVDNQAWADAPAPGPGPVTGSTPFLAVWDGKDYIIENDVLMSSRDNNYDSNLTKAKERYENGLCGPDLYKIRNNPKASENGGLKFQIREYDPEESFIDQMKLFKVKHNKDSEVVVDNKYQKFYVLARKTLQNLILPKQIVINGKQTSINEVFKSSVFENSEGVRLHYGQNIFLNFSGLDKTKNLYLIAKAKERALSPVAKTVFATFPAVKFLTIAVIGFVFQWFWKGAFSILPLFALMDGNRSINFSYKNKESAFQFFETVHPRMEESIELIPIPQEAILSGGNLDLKLEWTRTHQLLLLGIIELNQKQDYEVEELELATAKHSRIKSDFAPVLKNRDQNYLHTIQGDKVEIVFTNKMKEVKNDGLAETYLFSANGFYTDLRLEHQKAFRNLAWLIKEMA